MIIVDKALEKRQQDGNPIRVAVVGAGFIGRGVVLQIEKYIKGMRVVAVSNRTISNAKRAMQEAEIETYEIIENLDQLDAAIADGRQAITDDAALLCQAKGVDAVIEATSDVEYSAYVAVKAIENKKHIVLMNADLYATVGPILKLYADRAGVVIANTDGDQPAVMMNLFRFVKTIGYHPVMAGNIKGLQDFYRTPETQREFAEKNNLSAKMATSFADGTKISMENALVANATGFKVGKRGMYGPRCAHVGESLNLFPMDQLLEGGLVDYLLGAEPGPGVFVLGHSDHPIRQSYMRYFKMGEGPLYVFYIPYHLAHLEVPLTVARAVLFGDSAIEPLGGPVCDVLTVAKRDLKSGEVLDGIGGFTCYGMIDNSPVCKAENLLLMGVSEGCLLKRDIAKDQVITNDDVDLPEGRLIDRLLAEQTNHFSVS